MVHTKRKISGLDVIVVGLLEIWRRHQSRRQNLCRGRHPHLDQIAGECDQPPRAINLGASNGWFAVSLSVLAIPQNGNPLSQLIRDGFKFFEDCQSVSELELIVKTLKMANQLPEIDNFTTDEIWKTLEAYRVGDQLEDQDDLKHPEWEVLTSPELPKDYPHFMGEKVSPPEKFNSIIDEVVLLSLA